MRRIRRYALAQGLAVLAMLAAAALAPAAQHHRAAGAIVSSSKAIHIDGERFCAPSAVLSAGPTVSAHPWPA